MSATALWTAVKTSYNDVMLRQLTNVNTPGLAVINDTVGEDAAQHVIDIWKIYAQVDYDASDSTHVAIAERGVIATLWERAGVAAEAATVKWGEVFGPDGMISRLRNTDPRGHPAPSSNSDVDATVSNVAVRRTRPWADKTALPEGLLPTTRGAFND